MQHRRPFALAALALTSTLAVFAVGRGGRGPEQALEALSDLTVAPAVTLEGLAATGRTVGQAPAGDTAATLASGFYRLPVGRELELRFEAAIGSTLRQDQNAEPIQVSIDARGTLLATVVSAEVDDLALEMRLSDTELELSMPGRVITRAELEGARAELEQPFLVRIARTGELRGYRFADGLRSETRNLARTLVAALVPVIPVDAAGEWRSEQAEAAGIGSFVSQWEVAPATGVDPVLVRRKTRQAAIDNQGTFQVASSSGRTVFAAELAWPRTAEYTESLQLTVAEASVDVCMTSSASFELVRSGTAVRDARFEVAWDAAWAAADGATERESHGVDAGVAGLTGARSVTDLVQRISELIAAGQHGSRELYEAQLALARLLRTDPAALAALEQLLNRGVDATTEMVLLAAVGMAGTTASQQLLAATISREDAEVGTRVHAAWSSFQLEAPSSELVRAVQAVAASSGAPREIRQTSILALGTFSAKLGGQDEGALEQLLADEGRASAAGELTLWLEALGNAGAVSTVPRIAPYLQHADAAVRRAACSALRRIDTEETTALLFSVLADDAVAAVRAAAATVVVPRSRPEVDAATRDILRREAHYTVLDAIVRALGTRQPIDAATRLLLQEVAASAADPRLVASAQAILAPSEPIQ